jgi:hypothetical protein
MDGHTLATYVESLGLAGYVNALPDALSQNDALNTK